MEGRPGAPWHFWVMVLASLVVFGLVIYVVRGREHFRQRRAVILRLALVVVVIGMAMGKYGAGLGLPWWIYYPVPMLMNVMIPPIVLGLDRRQTVLYLVLSAMSAPFIHASFSFLLGWHEYMPFWRVPYVGEL